MREWEECLELLDALYLHFLVNLNRFREELVTEPGLALHITCSDPELSSLAM